MKTLKISKYFLVLIAAICMSLGFLTLTSVPTVKAEAPTGFVMNGASVRFKQDEETTETSTAGIRFESIIPQTEYAALGEVTEVGFLVVPRTKYNGEEIQLTTENAYIQKIVAVGGENDSKFSVKYNDVDYYAFRAYIYKIPQKSYYANLRVVSYITVGDDTYYTEVCTRSIAEVATKAYADTEATYTTEQRADLKSYIDLSVIQLFNNDLFEDSLNVHYSTDKVEILDNKELEGSAEKIGVADITFTYGDERQYFSFDLPIPVSEYSEAGYDLIGITLAVTDTEDKNLIFHYPYQTVDTMVFLKEAQLKAQNQWITYLVPFESSLFQSDGKTACNDLLYRLGKSGNVGKLHLCISEIRAYKSSEFITLSSHSTDEMIKITKAPGVDNVNVNYACEHTGSATLNNDVFYSSQSAFLISFTKTINVGENVVSSKYILFEKLNAKLATDVTKIGCTTTGELKINNSITWTLTGIYAIGSDNAICSGGIELIGPNGKVAPVYGWPTDGATMTFTPTEAGTYKVQMDGWCGSFIGKKIFEYYVCDKELTVSGSHTLNNNVMTLPAPILTSIGDTPTTSSFTIKNISVVIGENTFTSTTYDVTISKFGNYTATYVVTGEDGIDYTCTLSGTVADSNVLSIEGAPSKKELSVATLTLPTPILKDSEQNTLAYTNLEISLKKGDDSITVTDMTFNAEVGTYQAVYSVIYNGFTYNCTYDFEVVLPFSPVINSFNTAEELDGLTLTYPGYDSKRLLPSDEFGDLQYKDGVADITFTYNHISHLFKFNLPTSYSEYVEEGYDLIGITLAVSDASGTYGFFTPNENGEAANYIAGNTSLKVSNKWFTYLVPLYRNSFGADEKTGILDFNFYRPIGNIHLYIDEIRAYKSSELVAVSSQTTLSTEETITVSKETGVNNLKCYYATSPESATQINLNADGEFFAVQNLYLMTFEKDETDYVLFGKLKSKPANELTTIVCTSTGDLKINNPITLTISGIWEENSLPNGGPKLIVPEGSNVDKSWSWPNKTKTFTPDVAGTYKVQLDPWSGAFLGVKEFVFTITE